MGIKQTYAVLGLGRYGSAVACELVKSGAEVLAVDINEARVSAQASVIPICKCADITDRDTLERLGISNMDTVIIAMAGELEASVLATALCKEIGVKTVIVKCANEMQKKILLRVGADQVVFPENESGTRLAKNLLSSGFVDVIELSRDVSMVELDVRADWIGKTLLELNLRKKYSINVVAVSQGGKVNTNIDPEAPLNADMRLIVIANTAKLAKLK